MSIHGALVAMRRNVHRRVVTEMLGRVKEVRCGHNLPAFVVLDLKRIDVRLHELQLARLIVFIDVAGQLLDGAHRIGLQSFERGTRPCSLALKPAGGVVVLP
ncbi:hypothetical protein NUV26_12925 [Burkholderia pseudomultivorans]|uniref:hypothetical protein n=1 Tax=Burkholderia pseudomultivorans TaxID=1207504 RepID=UPI002150266C|nr:hypothetical protein [Burkholderia pseudomultivorans]MDS0793061.1 hypothetical protein [Burkholderia pseudomultivorans]